MKTISIYCKKCNERLTEELSEVSYEEIDFPEKEEAIPEGKFVFNKNNSTLSILTSRNQKLVNDHTDVHRFYGCCGSDGSNGLNKTCINKHEVATEFSDCYTSYYIEFSLKHVIVKFKTNANHLNEMNFKNYVFK